MTEVELSPREAGSRILEFAGFYGDWTTCMSQYDCVVRILNVGGMAGVIKRNEWVPFQMASTAVISRSEWKRNASDETRNKLKAAKEECARASLKQLAEDSLGNGRIYIPVLTENLEYLVDAGDVREFGEAVARKNALELVERHQEENDKYRKLGIEESGSYFKPEVEKVRFQVVG